VYRLIGLVAYHYQEVASAVVEATIEEMEKLSVLSYYRRNGEVKRAKSGAV
jgi:hypothetical protein